MQFVYVNDNTQFEFIIYTIVVRHFKNKTVGKIERTFINALLFFKCNIKTHIDSVEVTMRLTNSQISDRCHRDGDWRVGRDVCC